MVQFENARLLFAERMAKVGPRWQLKIGHFHMSEKSATKQSPWLTPGVLGIGLASLLSDWGHEAATAILPAFLASMGAPAVALGVIEGVADGLSTFAKLAGGWIADRPHLRKPASVAGYLDTAISTCAYAFVHSWPGVLLLRALGWTGRGNGPSRDALLTAAVAPEQIGRAFGFERAMDSAGAVAGPLCAAALIGTLGTRGVLKWTFVPGTLAALAFVFMVPASAKPTHRAPHGFASSFKKLPARFRRFLVAVFAHGAGDFAPTLLILRAAQILAPRVGTAHAAVVSVALYTFHNVVNAAVSYPAGALGDRIGKRGILAVGYAIEAVMCAGFIFATPAPRVLASLFALAGIHGAIKQSLEKSLAAELLPAETRGSGFGVLAAVNGIGDLVSSVAVGVLWSSVGAAAGFIYAGVLTLSGAALIYFYV
jgi:MFS family permease